MLIMIELCEKYYKGIVAHGGNTYPLVEAVRCGDILSKKHGRLIDISEGITNGKLIKLLFPNDNFFDDIFLEVMHYSNYEERVAKWWNAPYEGNITHLMLDLDKIIKKD